MTNGVDDLLQIWRRLMVDKNRSTKNKNHSQKLKEKRLDKRYCDSLYLVLGHIMSFRSSKFILAAVLLGFQFFFFVKDYSKYVPCNKKTLILFIVDTLFILVIMVFVFVAKSMGYRIDRMQYAFPDNKNYQNYVQAYYEWISICRTKYKGNYQVNTVFYIVYRVFYLFTWVAVSAIFIWYACKDLNIINHRLGIYAIVLYVISMILMGYTFFTTFAYILFLYNLSSSDNYERLQKYNYNKRMPDETTGFVQIKSDISIHTVCYMSVSLLYSFALPLLFSIDKALPFQHFYYKNSIEFYLVIILFSALCILGSLLVFPIPMIMLNRILSLWNKHTIQLYETEINRFQKKMMDESTFGSEQYQKHERRIDYLEEQIEHIRKKKPILKNNALPAFLTVLEFVSPLLSLAATIIT